MAVIECFEKRKIDFSRAGHRLKISESEEELVKVKAPDEFVLKLIEVAAQDKRNKKMRRWASAFGKSNFNQFEVKNSDGLITTPHFAIQGGDCEILCRMIMQQYAKSGFVGKVNKL
jgi:hypothetical protein